MSYRSILVNLDIDGPVVPVVKAAADLAGRFQAKLIGLCAADAPIVVAGPAGAGLAAEAWMQMRDDIKSRFKDVHDKFGKLIAGKAVTEWRETLDNPTRAVAEAARAADLIVLGAVEGAATGDAYRQADPGSIALQAGRPLLVVARDTEQVRARNIAVAWNRAKLSSVSWPVQAIRKCPSSIATKPSSALCDTRRVPSLSTMRELMSEASAIIPAIAANTSGISLGAWKASAKICCTELMKP